MSVIADFLQRAFAVDFLFQPAQRLVHGLAFFKPDFGQLYSLPLRGITAGRPGFIAVVPLDAAGESIPAKPHVNGQKSGVG